MAYRVHLVRLMNKREQHMQINVNTDKTIDHHAGLDDHVHKVVNAALNRFGEHISRVEVHLSEGNAKKSSDGDIRCMMEARVNGYQPIAVSDHDGDATQPGHHLLPKVGIGDQVCR